MGELKRKAAIEHVAHLLALFFVGLFYYSRTGSYEFALAMPFFLSFITTPFLLMVHQIRILDLNHSIWMHKNAKRNADKD